MAKLSDRRLADWLEQVADGLNAGMDPTNAVSLAGALEGGVSEGLQQALRNGKSWTEALDQWVPDLSEAERSVLEASAMSGRLPVSMRRIAEARREDAKVKRRARWAMAYPVFLMHFAALVFSITYLISGDTAAFAVSFGMVVGPLWLIIGGLFLTAKLWPEAIRAMTRSLPILSRYRLYRESGILCEVLASCFAAGMDVSEAWKIAVRAADSPPLYRVGDAVLAAVAEGRKASLGIEARGKSVPAGFLQLYRSGEETGTLEQNLEAAAARFLNEAKSKLTLASALYPKVILVGVFGYVAYKIISMVAGYYEELMKINA